MRFKVSINELSQAFASLSVVLPKKTIYPILHNVLIEAFEGTKLKLSVTDNEVYVSLIIHADVSENGKATVPLLLFSRALSRMKDEYIEFFFSEDIGYAEITAGRKKLKIGTLPADDFPTQVFEIEANIFKAVNVSEFLKCLRKVFHAISYDDSRLDINGIVMFPESTNQEADTVIAATDGKRLAVTRYPDALLEDEIIIPVKGIEAIKRCLPRAGAEVIFAADAHKVIFKSELFLLSCRLIDGKFPDVLSVLPKKMNMRAEFNAKELDDALKFVTLVNFGNHIPIIHLEFNESELMISARNSDIGDASVKLIYSGGISGSADLNANFITAALENAQSETIDFAYDAEGRPIMITAENYSALIMPLRTK